MFTRMASPLEALDRIRVGARIRELRTERGVTGADLARGIGVTRGHIANIESGRSRATNQTRHAIAGVLGVAVEQLEVAS